jgi:class 3 adenylate cyclase
MREIPATALIVDIRDFTPTYRRLDDAGEVERFFEFLEAFLEVNRAACHASFDGDPGDQLYLKSTGDGVLAVFESMPGEPPGRHAARAWLAGLRLVERLPALFKQLGGFGKAPFGIGIESGTVNRIGPGRLATRIGHCINRAARLEPITKLFSGTLLVIGEQANQHLVNALQSVDYDELLKATRVEGERAWAALRSANDALGVLWIGNLVLKGVERPTHVFRASPLKLSTDLAAMIGRVEAQLR